MGNIVLLDELTINKIAAGEVIERPASVVKEMVENSIDAGATSISVEIKNGGISYIRVTDNGKGIMKDDMEIAFERHATSKIRQASDLDQVKSMGFRGEALASIAAIANVEMISKTKDSDTGNRLVVEAGKILEFEEIGSGIGTTITVKNLFFNTPVRYKFLKKDYTESGYIEDVITRLALVHPNIAFKLINTGKTIIQTNGNGDTKTVIYSVYGKDIANAVIPIDYNYEDIHITGVVGKPEIARSNRSNQLFFVNKRYIKDKTLSSAIEKGFKGLLPIGKYGFVILNIDMDPSKVDVNVHPAKLEVRFQEESKVFKGVYHAINENLLKTELVANSQDKINSDEESAKTDENIEIEQIKKHMFSNLFRRDRKENAGTTIGKTIEKSEEENSNLIADVYNSKNGIGKEDKYASTTVVPIITDEIASKGISPINNLENMQKSLEEIRKNNNLDALKLNSQEINSPNMNETMVFNPIKENLEEMKKIELTEEKIKKENANDVRPGEILANIQTMNIEKGEEKFETMYEEIFGSIPKKDNKTEEDESKFNAYDIIKDNNISVFETNEEYSTKPNYKFIGIVFMTYIILEIDNEMYILDQHAAHERILYEKVKKNYYSDEEKDCQMLLLPDIITLTHKEMDIAKENFEIFKKAGFIVEEFGDNTVKLSGVPNICFDLDTKELFLETLDEINTVAITAKQEIEDRFLATVACKAAVKAHMALTKEEVEALMDELLKLPNPFTCPHGRPTAIKMSKNDIERKFARRK